MRQLLIFLLVSITAAAARPVELVKLFRYEIGHPIGQCRAVPVRIKDKAAVLLIHSKDAEIDPYVAMFFFPEHTTILTLISFDGEKIWSKDLGPGMVSGIWFLPVFPFDLNQDGSDEIWLVNNKDKEHPLNFYQFVLQRLDARTGDVMDERPWPWLRNQTSMSHRFRNFIFGGSVQNEPVLITAQGTYREMQLQGWNRDLSERWSVKIDPDRDKGARGSHVSPVLDINQDGIDEVLWGERAISFDDGSELFCADRGVWNGHSDIVLPVWNAGVQRWYIHTCREQNYEQPPRIVVFDDRGDRVWSAIDDGHIDTGWIARLGENGGPVVLGVRVGEKIRDQHGERRTGIEPFTFQAFTGEPVDLGFNPYTTIPVDLDGDGIHELVRGYFEGDGLVLDREGHELGSINGLAAMCCKFLDLPGEQILAYSHETGVITGWGDKNAVDSPAAEKRYARSFYDLNKRLTAVGYNLFNLGGL